MGGMSARKLVLDLVTARPETPFTVGAFLHAAQIVGLSEASVRMAVARLAEEGVLERSGRGIYRLHAARLTTYAAVENWRDRSQSRIPWDGGWIGADVSSIPRAERMAVRQAERSLRLAGMRPWRGALFLRPDNLKGGPAALRERLPGEVAVFGVADLAPDDENVARALWEPEELVAAVKARAGELAASLRAADGRDPEDFARESLELGSQAIATLVRDPLLPSQLCDTAPYERLLDLTARYQDRAQEAWGSLLWERT